MRLKRLSDERLFALYARIMRELKRRDVVRTANNPVADYAELLVADAFGLRREPSSNKGYDAIDRRGNRYEVKGRRLTPQNKSRQLSVIRDLPKHHFDYLAGVLFDEDFAVHRACRVPFDIVQDLAVYREHQNGWIVHLRDTVWALRGVQDITQKVRAKQEEFDRL